MSTRETSPLLVNSLPYTPGHGPFTLYLALVATIVVLGGFNYGYHIGVLNIPEQVIRNCTVVATRGPGLPDCWIIDDTLWGTIVGMFAIGGLVGGMFAGNLADYFGRKTIILLNNFFFISGSLLMGFAVAPEMMIAARILLGIGSGVSTVVVPMYLGEVSPTNYRGAIGVFTQLSITIGISISQLIGLGLSTFDGWRWLVGLTVFISGAQVLLVPLIVQTPRWLVLKGRKEEARAALSRLRGTDKPDILDSEVDYISEGQATAGGNSLSIREFFGNKDLRKPLFIAIILQLTQQLSGINAVFYYSTGIFEQSNPDNAQILTVSVGLLNVVLTILTIFLMDKAGRRVLLLIGEIGMIVTAGLYTVAFVLEINWLLIVCTYVYVSSFAVGLGPIPFLIIAEIFPTNAVGIAASIVLPLNWACNYLVGQLFPLMKTNLGDYAFLPFAGVLFIALLFTLRFVPETKGKTLEQVTAELRR